MRKFVCWNVGGNDVEDQTNKKKEREARHTKRFCRFYPFKRFSAAFVLKSQEFPYQIEPDFEILNHLKHVQIVEEKAAYNISKFLEPTSLIESSLRAKAQTGEKKHKEKIYECENCAMGMNVGYATWQTNNKVTEALQKEIKSHVDEEVYLHYWLRNTNPDDEPAWAEMRRWEIDSDVQRIITSRQELQEQSQTKEERRKRDEVVTMLENENSSLRALCKNLKLQCLMMKGLCQAAGDDGQVDPLIISSFGDALSESGKKLEVIQDKTQSVMES